MKEDYDFANAERGKFYKPSVELETPVYPAPNVAEYLQKLASEKGKSVNEIEGCQTRLDPRFLSRDLTEG